LLLLYFFLLAALSSHAQGYKNAKLAIQNRLVDLPLRMLSEEKVVQLQSIAGQASSRGIKLVLPLL
jgi:hypothetical protein